MSGFVQTACRSCGGAGTASGSDACASQRCGRCGGDGVVRLCDAHDVTFQVGGRCHACVESMPPDATFRPGPARLFRPRVLTPMVQTNPRHQDAGSPPAVADRAVADLIRTRGLHDVLWRIAAYCDRAADVLECEGPPDVADAWRMSCQQVSAVANGPAVMAVQAVRS